MHHDPKEALLAEAYEKYKTAIQDSWATMQFATIVYDSEVAEINKRADV